MGKKVMGHTCTGGKTSSHHIHRKIHEVASHTKMNPRHSDKLCIWNCRQREVVAHTELALTYKVCELRHIYIPHSINKSVMTYSYIR